MVYIGVASFSWVEAGNREEIMAGFRRRRCISAGIEDVRVKSVGIHTVNLPKIPNLQFMSILSVHVDG